MAAADRDERSDFGNPDAEPWNDEKRTARLIEIVDEYGWPAPDLAGTEMASAAWLIAQHSDANPAFQQRALRLLIEVTDYKGKGEHIALLTDRVAANTGKPQTYGSQIGCLWDTTDPRPGSGTTGSGRRTSCGDGPRPFGGLSRLRQSTLTGSGTDPHGRRMPTCQRCHALTQAQSGTTGRRAARNQRKPCVRGSAHLHHPELRAGGDRRIGDP